MQTSLSEPYEHGKCRIGLLDYLLMQRGHIKTVTLLNPILLEFPVQIMINAYLINIVVFEASIPVILFVKY